LGRIWEKSFGWVSTLARTHIVHGLLQEMSKRFQRRFGNVMLNFLDVSLANLGRDTQRNTKIHDDPVTGSRSLGERLSSVREKHSVIW
jgi:hypothetical protein